MDIIPSEVTELIKKRENYRKAGDFRQSDLIRRKILDLGYEVQDTVSGVKLIQKKNQSENINHGQIGLICFFGSGELSPTGRRIHELLVRNFIPPINICLLETPTGYEDNPHVWYRKLEKMMLVGLRNYNPTINRIAALRKDEFGTNNEQILSPMKSAQYIHTGAGSPTYAVKHLRDSLALKIIRDQFKKGVSVSMASAATIAHGRLALPVYEIYFAGHDPVWTDGLDFLGDFGLELTFIPHWNNKEGGSEIDTRYCYMGQKRFDRLLEIMPIQTTIIGIDEQTAVLFDLNHNTAKIVGNGTVTVIKSQKQQVFNRNQIIDLEIFKN